MNWKSLAGNVLATVTSAVILFILALLLRPWVYKLFRPGPDVSEYPLVCTFEPFGGQVPGNRNVDIFLVNMKDKSYSYEELQKVLNRISPDPSVRFAPTIPLTMRSDEPGRFVSVRPDQEFNKDKGAIRTQIDDDKRTARLIVERIAARAVMKVTASITGARDLGIPIERTADILVPFKHSDLQQRCYTQLPH